MFSADLLSRSSQQIFFSRSSQQIFSADSSQQIFSADLLSRSSQQIFSLSYHLLWSGVGGQLLSYHSYHLLWSGVGGQLLSYHLLWSGVGGQLLSYHVGGLYCMSSLEGPFRGAFGKNFTDGLEVDNRKAHCLLAMFRALNSYYGVSWSGREASTMAKKSAVQGLVKYAQDVIGWEEKFDGVRWVDLLSTRSIDYKGDEVRVSKQFRWSNIVSALPDEVGRIPLCDVCELGTLDYVVNFEDYLLPLDAQVVTRPPRVMVAEDSWEQVCSGLVSKGICEIMPIQDLYHVDGSPILNGMFGVSKDEFDNGVEVMRLIMNLIPVNKLCRNLGGDVSTLPNWSGMGSYVLETGEVLLMSSEDIRCFFYLFSVPQSWKRFLGFNKVVPPHLVPDQWQGLPCVLVSRVLPMGFVNSVSIAQHIHRRVARLGLYPKGQGGSGLGSQCEIRRDKALSVGSRAFRIYLDNFDLLEKVDCRVASVIKGEVSLDTVNLRRQYSAVGLPRHPKKTVARETIAEIQGAVVNGVTGRVTPKPSKVLKYLNLGLQLLSEGFASQKQLQIVCGGLAPCSDGPCWAC